MTRRVTTDVVAGLLLIACACTSSGGTGSSGGISGGRTHSLAGSALLETDGYSLLCGGAACSVPEGGVPASLQRPLHLPTLRPGQACPVSAARRVSRNFGPAIGSGPVFAAGLIGEGPFPFEYPPSKESIF